jgi:hypothetical protein
MKVFVLMIFLKFCAGNYIDLLNFKWQGILRKKRINRKEKIFQIAAKERRFVLITQK